MRLGNFRDSRRLNLSAAILLVASLVQSSVSRGTTFVPLSDAELLDRADVVIHGIVLSNEVAEDPWGRPETITVIRPLSVPKGFLSGNLVLHQLGGQLPDGRFFQLWGRPEYVPGREVIVFAISRPEGDFQTAEMLLGKFEIWEDEKRLRFAIPDLAIGVHPGVTVIRRELELARVDADASPYEDTNASPMEQDLEGPRDANRFLRFLREGAWSLEGLTGSPVGRLHPVTHREVRSGTAVPLWGNIGDVLRRWNNGATAAWTLNGTAFMTGGGVAEAANAVAVWTNHPNSTINYTIGAATPNLVHLNAMSSPCGWSTCFPGSGTIGCGGPSGGGSHSWAGETYFTITGGTVWLRCYSSFNQVSSLITQSVLEHEHGHTLGLGHSDQNFSIHDVCSGDESLAIMRSSVQARTTLGTDDEDAIRWIYGDGGNSCTSSAPAAHPVSADFDLDGLADKTIFRPTTGNWFVHKSDGTGQLNVQWGTSGDIPVPGNYGGDGRADYAVFRPSNGTWFVMTAEGAIQPAVQYGTAGDIPVPGNYGGDGRADYAVFRPSNGTWYILTAEGGQIGPLSWGMFGDVPVSGDYDGDAVTDLAVYRPSNGTWYVLRSSGGTLTAVFGQSTDIPVVADFSGDGRADFGIYRPSTSGTWFALSSDTLTQLPTVTYGLGSDAPLPANMGGDSRADKIVWRSSNGTWYVLTAEGGGLPAFPYGTSGDTPMAR